MREKWGRGGGDGGGGGGGVGSGAGGGTCLNLSGGKSNHQQQCY